MCISWLQWLVLKIVLKFSGLVSPLQILPISYKKFKKYFISLKLGLKEAWFGTYLGTLGSIELDIWHAYNLGLHHLASKQECSAKLRIESLK